MNLEKAANEGAQQQQAQTPQNPDVQRTVMIQIEDPSIALREEEEEDDPDVDVDLDDGESEKDEEIEDIEFPSRPQEADENPVLEPPLSSNSPSEGEQTMPT